MGLIYIFTSFICIFISKITVFTVNFLILEVVFLYFMHIAYKYKYKCFISKNIGIYTYIYLKNL